MRKLTAGNGAPITGPAPPIPPDRAETKADRSSATGRGAARQSAADFFSDRIGAYFPADGRAARSAVAAGCRLGY